MTEVLNLRFRVRRRTSASWAALNEVLLDSEIGLATDTRKLKTGDGVTPWNSLPYIDEAISLPLLAGIDHASREDGKALIWDEDAGEYRHGSAGAAYVAGDGIDIDDTDPEAPIISSTLGSIALSGRVANYASLPGGLSGVDAGKSYYVEADGRIYIWSGSAYPSSGAGVKVDVGVDLTSSYIDWDDYTWEMGTASTKTQLRASGSGAGVSVQSVAGRPGVLRATTGSSSGGDVKLTAGVGPDDATGMLNLSGMTTEYVGWFRVQTLYDAGNQYEVHFNFLDVPTGSAVNNIGVRYSYADNNGKLNLWIAASSTIVATIAGTTTISTNVFYRVRLVINADAGTVKVYLKVGAGTETLEINYSGTLPAAAVLYGHRQRLFKIAGTTARTCDFDGWQLKQYLTTSR